MCVDQNEPNEAEITDMSPLPHIDKVHFLLRGATVFPTIDLERVYFQLPLHEESCGLTVFISHDGLFSFVMWTPLYHPSRRCCIILKCLPNVANYLDDIIIWGCTRSERDKTLEAVLQHFQEAELQLNVRKCHYNRSSLHFLGYPPR